MLSTSSPSKCLTRSSTCVLRALTNPDAPVPDEPSTPVCNPEALLAVMATHRAALQRIFVIVLLVCGISASQAGKILIATTPIGKSHLMNLKKIAKEVEQRGNTIMVRLISVYIFYRGRLVWGSEQCMAFANCAATSPKLRYDVVSRLCSGRQWQLMCLFCR